MKIVLLQGGRSSERDISLKSSKAIGDSILRLNYELEYLDPCDYSNLEDFISVLRSKQPDLVFNGLHGGDGENGLIQAVLDSIGIKYTASGHKASAIAMDKQLTTEIAHFLKVPTPISMKLKNNHYYTKHNREQFFQFIESTGFPLVVKPNSGGSSVGTSIIEDIVGLHPTIFEAFKYDHEIVIQEYIKGREVTVGVLNDAVLPIVEIKPKQDFYNLKNKYSTGATDYICPASFSSSLLNTLQKQAKMIYDFIGCEVYGRIDFIYLNKKFYFLEINTLPGMTDLSLFPMASKESGLDFDKMIDVIIRESINKYK
jgi:D-alanine-D-alanine ligase